MESYKEIKTMILGETRDRTRCKTWVNYVTERTDRNFVLFLAAGTLPFSAERPLKKKMLDDITAMLHEQGYQRYGSGQLYKGNQSIRIILTEKNGWGTLEEIFSLIKLIGNVSSYELTVFSSKSHLNRIQNIFKLLAPQYKITTVAADADMSDTLINSEATKDKQTKLFFFIYSAFGEYGLTAASWIKNLILNVILAKN